MNPRVLLAIAALVLSLQSGTFYYVVNVEHRLTVLETTVMLRK